MTSSYCFFGINTATIEFKNLLTFKKTTPKETKDQNTNFGKKFAMLD